MRLIIGVDEVGRGPLAGPVVAAAVALPFDFDDQQIKDSKVLSARNRDKISAIIRTQAPAWCVVAVGHHRIAQLNILHASLLAMRLAVERVLRQVGGQVERILVDGNKEIPFSLSKSPIMNFPPQEAVVHGDRIHLHISAASIIAKVWRDSQMAVLDEKYPGYGLAKHAGYPTKQHREAISRLGPCPIHRRSFAGVREHLGKRPWTIEDKIAAGLSV